MKFRDLITESALGATVVLNVNAIQNRNKENQKNTQNTNTFVLKDEKI